MNAVHGVPDDRLISISLDPKHENVGYTYPGTASFMMFMLRGPFSWNRVWFGPRDGETGAGRLDPALPTVNMLADADVYRATLEHVRAATQDVRAPIFNAPDAIAATGRHTVADRLQGVDGLDAPRTIRTRPGAPEDAPRAAADAGLAFPVIARVAGVHGGLSIARMMTPDDVRPLHALPWGGRELYLTEYRDFRDPDGLFRKHRIFVVGGETFLRHVIVGDSWLLHAQRRAGGGAATRDEEAGRLAAFEADLKPRLAPVLAEIDRRLGLDFFGVDCHVSTEGRVTLFEANACMNVFHNSQPSPNIWDAPIRDGFAALVDLLKAPMKWKSAQGATHAA